jgi:hypothetical protein
MEILTVKNAKTAKLVKNIQHPEWGSMRFSYNAQPLNDGCACSTAGSGSNSRVLFESEYKFWEVIA